VFPVFETARYPTKSLVTREAAKDTTIRHLTAPPGTVFAVRRTAVEAWEQHVVFLG
jgi:hypothetical protein